MIYRIVFMVLMAPSFVLANHMDILLKRECDERIDPKITYFTCKVDNKGLHIHVIKDKSQLSEEQSKRRNIYYRYIKHWFLDTNGRAYKITTENSDIVKICTVINKRTGYHCKEYTKQSDGKYIEIKK